jgi:hypothetical protein
MSEAYKSAKIYKIVSEIGKCTYYGSTIQPLCQRLSKHKTKFKCGIYYSSSHVLKYPDYKIVLVEEYPCNSRLELCMREGWYISNNECVNKLIAGRDKKQWDIDNKQHVKQYNKQYRIDNKQYYKQYKKRYQIDNKQYINQRLMCDCGISYTRQNKSQHNKTKRHIQRMNNPFSTMLI